MKDQLIGQQFLAIPVGALPNDPQMFIGVDIPQAVINLVQSEYGVTMTTIAIIKYQRDANDYWFDALINDAVGNQFGIIRGIIGAVSNISQRWIFNLVTNSVAIGLGNGPQDSSVNIGLAGSGAVIRVLQDPLRRVELDALTAVRLMLAGVENLRVDSTGVNIPTGIGWNIDNISAGRGTKLVISAIADLVLIPVAGLDAIPITSFTFQPHRAYSLQVGGEITGSVVNRMRITPYVQPGGAANELFDFGWFGPTEAAHPYPTFAEGLVVNSTGAGKTRNVGVFVQTSAGTCTWSGTGSSQYFFRIRDVGHDSDYLNVREVP